MRLIAKRLSYITAVAVATIISTPVLAQSTTINFDDLAPGFSNYDSIPTTYGSNAVNTPNVAVSYASFDTSNNSSVNNILSYWSTGYGDLANVAFATNNGLGARVILTPSAGSTVTLDAFDLAGYFETDLEASFIRVRDLNGNTLWNAPSLLVAGAGPSHSTYSPGVSSGTGLQLEWGTNWNIGVDNIRFRQDVTPSVAPEASTLGLLAVAAPLALGVVARRRNRKG